MHYIPSNDYLFDKALAAYNQGRFKIAISFMELHCACCLRRSNKQCDSCKIQQAINTLTAKI